MIRGGATIAYSYLLIKCHPWRVPSAPGRTGSQLTEEYPLVASVSQILINLFANNRSPLRPFAIPGFGMDAAKPRRGATLTLKSF